MIFIASVLAERLASTAVVDMEVEVMNSGQTELTTECSNEAVELDAAMQLAGIIAISDDEQLVHDQGTLHLVSA